MDPTSTGAGVWPLLDDTARRNLDAEIRAQGFSTDQPVDFSSDTPPAYVGTNRQDVTPFGSTAVPSQASDGKPAVPAGSNATAYGSYTLTNALGPQWPLILGGAALVLVLVIARG